MNNRLSVIDLKKGQFFLFSLLTVSAVLSAKRAIVFCFLLSSEADLEIYSLGGCADYWPLKGTVYEFSSEPKKSNKKTTTKNQMGWVFSKKNPRVLPTLRHV